MNPEPVGGETEHFLLSIFLTFEGTPDDLSPIKRPFSDFTDENICGALFGALRHAPEESFKFKICDISTTRCMRGVDVILNYLHSI